jgi:hypothetical protein
MLKGRDDKLERYIDCYITHVWDARKCPHCEINDLKKEIERLKKGIDKSIYNLANEDISDEYVVDQVRMDLVKVINNEPEIAISLPEMGDILVSLDNEWAKNEAERLDKQTLDIMSRSKGE